MAEVQQIARQIENATRSTGDDSTIAWRDVSQQLTSMQSNDGGQNSVPFQQHMAELNQKLHDDGVLPNIDITGVDDHYRIQTKAVHYDN